MRLLCIIIISSISLGLMAQSLNFDSDNLTIVEHDSICIKLYNNFDYYNALPCYLDLIDRYEDSEDEDAYFDSKLYLSEIYFGLGYVRESAGLAAQIAEYFKGKNEASEAHAKILLSEAYLALGEIEKSKAVIAGFSANKWKRQEQEDQIRYQLLSARHLSQSGDTTYALEKLDLATQRCLDHDEAKYYPYIQYEKGNILRAQSKNRDALRSYLKASKVAEESQNLFLYVNVLNDIIEILAEYERYEQAFELTTERTSIRDSLFNLKQQETASRMIAKYESQKKQKTIYDLKGEQRATELKTRRSSLANYALMISFLAVLAAAYLIITFYQQKLSSSQIITTQKELINQQKITELQNNLQIESMQSMMQGQELERERVAKDLHDSLGGLLSAIKLKFEALHFRNPDKSSQKEYDGLQGLLDHACQEVRNISNNLQPGALETLGLIEALSDLINKYEQGSDIEIHFQHYGVLDNKRLNSFTSLNVYRIIQELLNNTIKHAQAHEVIVQLNRKPGKLTIMVEDDGVGYDTHKVKEGMGSENVRSRVNFLKADMSIDSIVGEGTTTLITIPIQES